MGMKMIPVALLLRYDIRSVGEEGKYYLDLVTQTALSDDEQCRNPPTALLTMRRDSA